MSWSYLVLIGFYFVKDFEMFYFITSVCLGLNKKLPSWWDILASSQCNESGEAGSAGVRPSRGKKVIDTVISLRLFVWITRQPVLGLDKILWHRQVSRVNPQQPFIQSQYEEHLTYILLPAGRDLLEIYIFYKSIEIYTESIWRGKKWAEKTLEELLSISSSAQWFSKGCHLITCSLLCLRRTRPQGIWLSPDPLTWPQWMSPLPSIRGEDNAKSE